MKTTSHPRRIALGGLVLSTLLAAPAAHAVGLGITGYNGAPGMGQCSLCHIAPNAANTTIAVAGPVSLQAGAKGTYTLTITSPGTTTAGFAMSSDNTGVKFTAGTGTRVVPVGVGVMAETITHMAAAPSTAGVTNFTFEVTAPTAGNSFNLFIGAVTGQADLLATPGDGVAGGNTTIQVVGGTQVPAPVPDAGTPANPANPANPTPGTPGTATQTPQPPGRPIAGPAVIYGDMGCSAAGAGPLVMLALATLVVRARRRAGR